ncbi:hypothetical protein GQ54DRAFT_321829 [Martensiomyces pterosporus]|nr:hypothetical protein GQ54DRAFT_321829 [Martensiomyces pterosporus]
MLQPEGCTQEKTNPQDNWHVCTTTISHHNKLLTTCTHLVQFFMARLTKNDKLALINHLHNGHLTLEIGRKVGVSHNTGNRVAMGLVVHHVVKKGGFPAMLNLHTISFCARLISSGTQDTALEVCKTTEDGEIEHAVHPAVAFGYATHSLPFYATRKHDGASTFFHALHNLHRLKLLFRKFPFVTMSIRPKSVDFSFVRTNNSHPVVHCPSEMLLGPGQPFGNICLRKE